MTIRIATLIVFFVSVAAGLAAPESGQLKLQVFWEKPAYQVKLLATGGVEAKEKRLSEGSISAVLEFPVEEFQPIQNLQIIWADLIAHSDADTVRRLTEDPAFRPDRRRLTILLDPEGTRGFSLTIDQLLSHRKFWVPSLGVYVATGDKPVSKAEHLRELEPWKGRRILDQVAAESEATYEQYKARWEDMGSPNYSHPAQRGPGHIVCLTWDSALAKFGVDRGAGVWNDYGNPDQFRFWFGFSNQQEGIAAYWKSQHLADGLPVITTELERDGVRYEIEQFAYPLDGLPSSRRGDLDMVLLQRVRMTDLLGRERIVPVTMFHERKLSGRGNGKLIGQKEAGTFILQDDAHRNTLLWIETGGAPITWSGVRGEGSGTRLDLTLRVELPAGGSREFVVKLPSPVVPLDKLKILSTLDYLGARRQTLDFWARYVDKGARFEVPEKAVNDLYRASLWHALRLPRRHADTGAAAEMDLPYSNFAYDQSGTPWPVNQAVYVDYMLYGLRGYESVATEEMETIYRNNQEFDGRVNGYAQWVVYTPGMLYAIGQNYLLSNDTAGFERLLPSSLKALDWCLGQLHGSGGAANAGLVYGPLNDNTGSGYWAFNQAYMYAGLDCFGKALERAGHPRAGECREAAARLRPLIEAAFRKASVQSPLVELRDHTWVPYIPCEATHEGRIYDQWYPTDVDTGAVHMLRLDAVPAASDLGDWLLDDHEDNLYLHGWGMANEPVYNQQATAYLKRDNVGAVIRAFYSYMASAFSHSVFEPVEHRWTWGQYFGPPSTDGAWFELYRNMLVRESDDRTLLIGQAAPRAWLQPGKRIIVERAPTWFGHVSFTIESQADSRMIAASVKLDPARRPGSLRVRLRHPDARRIARVTVNGQPWSAFDPAQEWIEIKAVDTGNYDITAFY